jgi:TetR/AcrR family transcriptional repressor of nem operon
VKGECDSKIKLLRVAMELISESSYGSVSVDDICRKADVRKGSFYYFFPSKADLTVAAMEADWRTKQPDLDRVFSSQTPPLQRFEDFLALARHLQESKRTACGKICGCPMITLGAELSTQDEKIRLKTVEIMQRYVRYIESAVRDAAADGQIDTSDPRALAEEIFAYFQGVLLQAKVRNDPAPLRALEAGVSRLLGLPAALAKT